MQLKGGDFVVVPTRYGKDMARVLGVSKKPIGIKQADIVTIDRDFKTYEGARFDDELARWKKYHPELKDFGKAGK